MSSSAEIMEGPEKAGTGDIYSLARCPMEVYRKEACPDFKFVQTRVGYWAGLRADHFLSLGDILLSPHILTSQDNGLLAGTPEEPKLSF